MTVVAEKRRRLDGTIGVGTPVRRPPNRASRERRRPPTRAARFRRAVGDRGAVFTVVPANLPGHESTPRRQAAWVHDRMEGADAVTIAECPPALVRAIKAYPGLRVIAASPNYGGNGNAVVVRVRAKAREYRCEFRANGGRSFTLHMARAVVRKGRSRVALDAVHCPSQGRWDTSSSDVERAKVIRQIARAKVGRRVHARIVAGDWNDSVEFVLRALHQVDRRWVHLGGAGVEQVFGLGAVELGDVALVYGPVSDHERTAKVKAGVRLAA